ncbi:MAG: hypothetical protein FJX53_12305, partial [Alphaproteobacteria bacterium]|nr:hypothetical protein [Alphaproteobacteria bacterium]
MCWRADRRRLHRRRDRLAALDSGLQAPHGQADGRALPPGRRRRPRARRRPAGRRRRRAHAGAGARRHRAGRRGLRRTAGGGIGLRGRAARRAGAARRVPGQRILLLRGRRQAAVDRAFAGAAHVVEQRLVINRITANAMEPRGAIGEWDEGTGRYTLHTGFQRPWLFRNTIAGTTLKIPETKLRLVTGDIGGSFGLRGSVYPELILVLWAARRVGRPVKWIATRSESHISDDEARDNIVDAGLALDASGNFLAVRVRSWANLGAYVSFRGALPPVVNIGSVAGTYTTKAIHVGISGMFTNTHCTSPYSGARRPEAAYMIERLIDLAARRFGRDPADLRRQNTVPASAMPYRTPLTYTWDSGHFDDNLEKALALADHAGFPARRAEAAKRGRLRGIGVTNTIEQAADATVETAELRFDAGGDATLVTGSVHHGQGHYTVQSQILYD